MVNRLSSTTSPYLKQHQDNPVDWFPWSDAAITRAKAREMPIFLSIGYSACHWCHVMAHETFEDPDIAQLLNEHFVSIKVDREERPDLDDVYMQAVLMMTGQGGWPMSVFLTPDLEPFYGGTYFPPEPRYGMPSFRQVLLSVIHAWKNEKQNILTGAENISTAIHRQFTEKETAQEPFAFNKIVSDLYQSYDWQYGGWGNAPKFPPAMLLEFLNQMAWRGDPHAREMLEHLLTKMAMGGMYDLVGGGFHRYSVDRQWLVPHFEKMLYDNALLAQAYLHGFAVTNNPRFRQVAEQTLEFIQEEMTAPQGGFYASLDADTLQGEGRYYTWDYTGLLSGLSPSEFAILEEATTVRQEGNFEDRLNLLRYQDSIKTMAGRLDSLSQDSQPELGTVFAKLKSIRSYRQAPGKDTKIILSWNALTIRAMVSAGLFLGRKDFIVTARNALDFILGEMITPFNQLNRIWYEGTPNQPGTLSDYAGLILALHAMYEVDFSPETYQIMLDLYGELKKRFTPEEGLYYDSAVDVKHLLVRPKTLQDNAIPSGNALAAHAHWLFWNYEGQNHDLENLDAMLSVVAAQANHHPQHFGYWLQIADRHSQKVSQIALVALKGMHELTPFLSSYQRHYNPYSVIAARSMQSNVKDLPSLLADKTIVDNMPTAYICRNLTCQRPLTDPKEFLPSLIKPDHLA